MVNDLVTRNSSDMISTVKFVTDTNSMKAVATKATNALSTHVKKIEQSAKVVDVAFRDVTKSKFKFEESFRATPFAGWAMSLMFAGMAMQRIATQIYQFGTKTFNEISHSVEGTVTQTDLLEGSMKYLGYTIGEALQPVVEWITPIVDKISDWVEQNPELVAGITKVGIELGTLAAAGGALWLAKNGITDFATLIRTTSWKGLGGGISQGLKDGIGTIAIGYSVVQAVDAFNEFSEGNFARGMLEGLSAAALMIGGVRLIRGASGGGALIAIGVALEMVKTNSFFSTIGKIIAIAFAAFDTLGQWISHTVGKALNGIENSFFGLIKKIADSVVGRYALKAAAFSNSEIDTFRSFKPTNYEEFDFFDTLTKSIESHTPEWGKKFDTAIAKALEDPMSETAKEVDKKLRAGFEVLTVEDIRRGLEYNLLGSEQLQQLLYLDKINPKALSDETSNYVALAKQFTDMYPKQNSIVINNLEIKGVDNLSELIAEIQRAGIQNG